MKPSSLYLSVFFLCTCLSFSSYGQIKKTVSFSTEVHKLYEISFVDTSYDKLYRRGKLHINIITSERVNYPTLVTISSTDKAFTNWKKTSDTSYSVDYEITPFVPKETIEMVLSLEGDNGCSQIHTFTASHNRQAFLEKIEKQVRLIYPNPVKDILAISKTSNKPIQALTLVDLNGKTIQMNYEIKNDSYLIDLSGYSPGQYILEIIDGDSLKEYIKVIKE